MMLLHMNLGSTKPNIITTVTLLEIENKAIQIMNLSSVIFLCPLKYTYKFVNI